MAPRATSKGTSLAHFHTGWFCCLENEKILAARIKAGECTVVRSHDEINGNSLHWCLTHNQEATYGHHQDNHPTARFDSSEDSVRG